MLQAKKLFEAAFYPPPRAEDANDQSKFAVLPQNTEDELTLSEFHSKLDRALTFLQRDVGYALLDDVRPHTGGGVRLRQPPPRANAAIAKGDRSAKLPKEPLLSTSSAPSRDSPEDLDDSIIKLLRVIFERSGGKLRCSELAEEVYRRQATNFRSNGQLDRLFKGIRIDQDREITWEEFEALHANNKGTGSSCAPSSASTAPALQAIQSPPQVMPIDSEEIVAMSPEVSKYAHYQCDLVMVSRFAHVLYKGILQELWSDAEKGLITHAEAKKRCSQAVKHDGVYKTVLQGVRLMHLCDYDYADVVLVLGYATVYFRSTFSSIGKKMSPNEAAHVVVLLIYLAHAFLLDETCPLRIWQKHIFRKYCTLKVLDAALFRLFQMRPGFKLRISDEEERTALLGLSGLQYSLKVDEDDAEEASDAIKQLMGANANFTHPKLTESKEPSAGNGTNGEEEQQRRQPVASNSRKSPSNGLSNGAAQSGSSSTGSNGRSPPGSGQSADRNAEDSARRIRQQVPAPAPVTAGRLGEAPLRGASRQTVPPLAC